MESIMVREDANLTAAMLEKGPHIAHVPLQEISVLAPFSALILCIVFVIYFIIRMYLLEGYLLKKVYGEVYTSMNEITRRGFVNHHIAGATKLAILIMAAYPFIDVAFGTANLNTPFAGSKIVTMGDVLIIAAQALIAMYVFELFYRQKVSPVSAGHHIGTIMIGQSAIAISMRLLHEKDATIEFILCTTWGAFDIVSEFLPHISIILYRVYPTSHNFLRKLFRVSAITTLSGTIAETIVTMWLFGSLWDKWTIAFKVTTPLLHALFMSCQMWGSWNFYKMYKRQEYLMNKKGGDDDLEGSYKQPGDQQSKNSADISLKDIAPSMHGSEAPLDPTGN